MKEKIIEFIKKAIEVPINIESLIEDIKSRLNFIVVKNSEYETIFNSQIIKVPLNLDLEDFKDTSDAKIVVDLEFIKSIIDKHIIILNNEVIKFLEIEKLKEFTVNLEINRLFIKKYDISFEDEKFIVILEYKFLQIENISKDIELFSKLENLIRFEQCNLDKLKDIRYLELVYEDNKEMVEKVKTENELPYLRCEPDASVIPKTLGLVYKSHNINIIKLSHKIDQQLLLKDIISLIDNTSIIENIKVNNQRELLTNILKIDNDIFTKSRRGRCTFLLISKTVLDQLQEYIKYADFSLNNLITDKKLLFYNGKLFNMDIFVTDQIKENEILIGRSGKNEDSITLALDDNNPNKYVLEKVGKCENYYKLVLS